MAADLDRLTRQIARVLREQRLAAGATLADLARETGLSKTILGRIENGHGNPSIETLFRIARGLDLQLSSMLVADEPTRVRLIPRRSGPELRADSGMSAWLVQAQSRGHHAELYELDLPAAVDQRSAGHRPGTEELVICVSGRLRVGPLGEEVLLSPGDAVWFSADGEHHYEALRASRALDWIVSPAAT